VYIQRSEQIPMGKERVGLRTCLRDIIVRQKKASIEALSLPSIVFLSGWVFMGWILLVPLFHQI